MLLLVAGMALTTAAPPGHAVSVAKPSSPPASIAISTIPSELPADNATYPAILVSLIDANSQPTAALVDTEISLVVAQQNVGSVTEHVEIPITQTYAIANFTTTGTPGTTVVTATALGYLPASTTVTTVIPVGYPTQLVMTAVPSTVPVGASSTGKLILLLEDAGQPAKAIADTSVSLYSSNPSVVSLPESTVVIGQGGYLLEVNYTVGSVPGPAVVTASSAGFQSGTSSITVLGSPPLALKLIAQPAVMTVCNSNVTDCSGRLVVALTDLQGNPTTAENDTVVQIRSSNLAIIDTVETVTIQKGNISATAPYNVTGTAGFAEMTASAPNLQSGFAVITTTNPGYVSAAACESTETCDLEISAGPNPVLADARSYSSVVVSMEVGIGSGGATQSVLPAINATGPTQVTLTSSVTGVGNFSRIVFTIPEGRNWAAISFNSTFQVGTTQLTISADNMVPTQTSLATYGPVPSQLVVKSIVPDLPADGTTHPALELELEDSQGSPAIAPFAISVNLTSSDPSIAQVGPVTIPSGQASVLANATTGLVPGTANVTAIFSRSVIEQGSTSGYATSSAAVETIVPAPSSLEAFAPQGGVILLGQGKQVSLLAVQLQDGSGHPARARAPMNITLTPSNSTVIAKVLTVQVSVGQDYALVPLSVLNPGTTTLTIGAPGFSVTSIVLTFLSDPVSESITGGPASVTTSQTAVISVSVTLDGQPAAGVPISWNATTGGLTVATVHSSAGASSKTTTSTTASTTAAPQSNPEKAVTDSTSSDGTSTVIYHPSAAGTAKVYAMITPEGYSAKVLNFTVTVTTPPPPPKVKPPSVEHELTTFPLVLVPVGAGAGVVAAVTLVRRRRSGGEEIDDGGFDTSLG